MHKLIIAALATVLSTAAAAQYRPVVPVTILGARDGHEEITCGTGVVRRLDPRGDGFLAVKAGPGLAFDRIDRLFNGDPVYICGQRGEWLAVVYTRARQDCNLERAWPRTMAYTGPCRSGWAHGRWITAVSG
jgi:hypothetical protein